MGSDKNCLRFAFQFNIQHFASFEENGIRKGERVCHFHVVPIQLYRFNMNLVGPINVTFSFDAHQTQTTTFSALFSFSHIFTTYFMNNNECSYEIIRFVCCRWIHFRFCVCLSVFFFFGAAFFFLMRGSQPMEIDAIS